MFNITAAVRLIGSLYIVIYRVAEGAAGGGQGRPAGGAAGAARGGWGAAGWGPKRASKGTSMARKGGQKGPKNRPPNQVKSMEGYVQNRFWDPSGDSNLTQK